MIPFEEKLLVSESRITIDHTAGIDTSILVQSNGLWSTSVFNDSWLRTEASGEMNDTLRLIFDENPNASDRRNRVYVATNGGESFLITVTQLGKPSAVDDLQTEDQFVLYPNPTSGELFIESSQNGLLSVFSQSGQKLTEIQLEFGNHVLDLSKFRSGFYFVRI